MRKKMGVLILVAIFIVPSFFFEAKTAGEQPKSLIYLGKYHLKPDKVKDFESVMKDFIREMKKYRLPYSFAMYSTDHFIYYSINEFTNHRMLDQFEADWAEVEKKIGAETMDKYHRIEFSAIHSFKTTLLRYKPDYSYFPEIPCTLPETNHFTVWTFFYINPIKKGEWIKLQKKWIEFYKKNKVKMAQLSFTGRIGYEMPVWVHKKITQNRLDYFQETEKIQALFEEEMKELLESGLPIIRRVEEVQCIFRPDLSYYPE